MSNHAHTIPHDPIVAEKIRVALAADTVESPASAPIPKPKLLTPLAKWKIAAAARQSPAARKAKIELRWYSPRKEDV
jgi:hypothetical protein